MCYSKFMHAHHEHEEEIFILIPNSKRFSINTNFSEFFPFIKFTRDAILASRSVRTRRAPNRFGNSFGVPFDGANSDFEEDEEIEQAAGENSSSNEDSEIEQNRQRARRRAKRTEGKQKSTECENRTSEMDTDAEMDSDTEMDSGPPAHLFSDSESDEDFEGFANRSFSWTDREVDINEPWILRIHLLLFVGIKLDTDTVYLCFIDAKGFSNDEEVRIHHLDQLFYNNPERKCSKVSISQISVNN